MLTSATYSLGLTTWALQNQNSGRFSRGRQEITYALTPLKPRNNSIQERWRELSGTSRGNPGSSKGNPNESPGSNAQRRPKHDIALLRNPSYSRCDASMVALRTLRSHGLPLDSWRK